MTNNSLEVSHLLGKLISEYFRSAQAGDRDCRLLIPGLTPEFARNIHSTLMSNGVKSFLVIGPDGEPNSLSGEIRPLGLTSQRIGSFVAVVSPGQLAHIHDSIRGSGGTIRSLVFSEEWPWIDDGPEAFQFDGPVLDRLLENWTENEEDADRDWLRRLILDVLLPCTRTSSERSWLFLEQLLGAFDPSAYPELPGIREKFLFHSGIPRPKSILMEDVRRLDIRVGKLTRSVVDRYRRTPGLRDRIEETIAKEIEDKRQAIVSKAAHSFLDSIGASRFLNLGSLAFYGCWGIGSKGIATWRTLDFETLEKIFEVPKNEGIELNCTMDCSGGERDKEGNNLAVFLGETIDFTVQVKVPPLEFSRGEWQLAVFQRQSRLVSELLLEPQQTVKLELDTSVITRGLGKRIPLRVILFQDEKTRIQKRLGLHLCGPDRPFFVCLKEPFNVVDAIVRAEDEDNSAIAPDDAVILEKPAHAFLFSHGSDEVSAYNLYEDKEVYLERSKERLWRTRNPIDTSALTGDLLTIQFNFSSSTALIRFEPAEIEKGEFTLEDELRESILGFRGKESLKDILKHFAGCHDESFAGLGKLNKAAINRITLARWMMRGAGWKPILMDLRSNPTKQFPTEVGQYLLRVGSIDAATLENRRLREEAVDLVRGYSDSRENVRNEIESRYREPLISEHPSYARYPIFVEDSNQIRSALASYLGSYEKILAYIKREQDQGSLRWFDIFVLTHLDCVIDWQSKSAEATNFLLGPWHPLVLAKRYMVQSALYWRGRRRVENYKKDKFQKLCFLLHGIEGFRLVPSVSSTSPKLVPANTTLTSDPGWHFARGNTEDNESIHDLIASLRVNYGLDMLTGSDANNALISKCVRRYTRAFPSRRCVMSRARSNVRFSAR